MLEHLNFGHFVLIIHTNFSAEMEPGPGKEYGSLGIFITATAK